MRSTLIGSTRLVMFVLVCMLAFVGCEGDTGPAGVAGVAGGQGPPGPPGQDGDTFIIAFGAVSGFGTPSFSAVGPSNVVVVVTRLGVGVGQYEVDVTPVAPDTLPATTDPILIVNVSHTGQPSNDSRVVGDVDTRNSSQITFQVRTTDDVGVLRDSNWSFVLLGQ